MKKVISLLLMILLCFGMLIPVSAGSLTEAEGSGSREVDYGVDTTFTVTIPQTITASGANEETHPFDITVSSPVIPYGTELKVKATYNNQLALTDHTSVVLPYNLWLKGTVNDTKINTGDMAMRVPAGTKEDTTATLYTKAEGTPLYSGTYTGTINFQILVEDVVTTLTPEEIENDTHVFGIGKTKREYVIATFNDDFTEVVITKNGDDSDGLMVDWINPTAPFENPMFTNKATLKTLDIKSGVKNVGDYMCVNCTNIEGAITIPNTVKTIGLNAFYKNSKVSTLDLGKGVEVIRNSGFARCTGLTGTLNMPDSLKFIGHSAFDLCSKLTTLNIGKNVEFIGCAAFQDCNNISNAITLPDKLYAIGDFAFGHCYKLGNTTLTIPASVKHIGGMSENKLPPEGGKSINYEYTLENYKEETYLSTGTHTFYLAGSQGALTSYAVEEGSTTFKAVDGVLYTKDGTRLISYPSKKTSSGAFEIPEGVVTVDELSMSTPREIVLPDSFVISPYADAPKTQINYENTLEDALYFGDHVITVKSTNTKYMVEDGILYSIDGKICYHIPTSLTNPTIRNGCKTIEGATLGYSRFKDGRTVVLTIPASVTKISNDTSATYPECGTINYLNASVDNKSVHFSVVIDPANTEYEVNAENGHIVEKP